MERAFRAVRRSEVAVLVLDASEGVTQQDFRLAEYIVSRSRALPCGLFASVFARHVANSLGGEPQPRGRTSQRVCDAVDLEARTCHPSW